jgi:EKC/KEOPS complex subunit CGI121/TPRKB
MLVQRFPQFEYSVLITLFANVENAAEIRKQLLAGNPDFEYAFLSAKGVQSMEQLMLAVYRAMNDLEAGFLRTKNIHSETVFCMSPNNNIMEALRRFGIDDDTQSFYAIKITKSDVTPFYEFLCRTIQGSEVSDLDALTISEFTNENIVKKVGKQAFTPMLYTNQVL